MPKGRKPTKKDAKVTCVPLSWPMGFPRTAEKDRTQGPYHVRTSESMKRNGVTGLQSADKAFRTLLKKMGITQAEIGWECAGHAEAADPSHFEPAVVVRYYWRDKERTMCCDRFNTVIANLRACTEVIGGFYMILRSGCVHDFSQTMEKFTSSMAIRMPIKAPSKAHLDPIENWLEILEFTQQEMDFRTGLPKDPHSIGRRKTALWNIYHTDKPTAPDEESIQIINMAVDYLADMVEGVANMGQNQEAAKARARQMYEERVAAKKAEAEAKAAAAEDAPEVTEEKPEETAPPPEAPHPDEPTDEELALLEAEEQEIAAAEAAGERDPDPEEDEPAPVEEPADEEKDSEDNSEPEKDPEEEKTTDSKPPFIYVRTNDEDEDNDSDLNDSETEDFDQDRSDEIAARVDATTEEAFNQD